MTIHFDSSKNFSENSLENRIYVSLFVIEKKSLRMKRVNFNEINLKKLNQWKVGQRFVAIVETSDIVYAHTNQKFVKVLENQNDLSINGKKVAVNALPEKEYQRLDDVFGEYIRVSSEEGRENLQQTLEEDLEAQAQFQQYLACRHLLSDQMIIDFLIAHMENIPSKVVLLCLKILANHSREQARFNKEDQDLKELSQREIQRAELKREILKRQYKLEDIYRFYVKNTYTT